MTKRNRAGTAKFHDEDLITTPPSAYRSSPSRLRGVSSLLHFPWRRTLRMCCALLLTVPLSTILAIAMYTLWYWSIVPSRVDFTSKLYFDFQAVESPPPVAHFRLARSDQQWLRRVDRILPRIEDAMFDQEEEYDVEVILQIPDVERNHQAGTFMVQVEFFGGKYVNVTLAKSKRPVALEYNSFASSVVRDVVLIPVRLFTSWFRPYQTLIVPMFEKWTEDNRSDRALCAVRATLSDARLVLESASISFRLRLNGIRYFMRYWFWTTLIVFTLLGSWILSFVVTGSILSVFFKDYIPKFLPNLGSSPINSGDEDEENEVDDKAEEREEDKPPRTKREGSSFREPFEEETDDQSEESD